MRTARFRLSRVVAIAALVGGVGACGSGSDDAAEPDARADSSDEASGGQATVITGAPAGDDEAGDEDIVVSDDNPVVLGFEISGPAGTVIETTTAAVADATAQPELDQTWQLTDEPKWQLFTTFVDGAVITLKVTEGGPATIVGFRGTAADPNDPTRGYVMAEELSTVELVRGTISVLSLP